MKEYSPLSGARENIKRWQVILSELRIDNIQLKNTLSGIIKKDINSKLLEKAEHFQQRFVQKDQLIDLLRLDITRLLKWSDSNEAPADLLLYNQTGNDIDKLVVEFDMLKDSFSFFAAEARKAP